MATNILIPTIKWFLCFSLILLFVSSNCKWFAIAYDVVESKSDHQLEQHFHTFEVSSLLRIPSPTNGEESCNNPSTTKGKRGGNSLEVRHRHGACSSLKSDELGRPTHAEMLQHDEQRVDSIRERVRPKLVEVESLDHNPHGPHKRPKRDGVKQNAVGLPAKSGKTIGSGNFVVTIGLGTPKKDLTLIFDTGSDFTWTQCAPCKKSCYKQQEPVFNPSQSSTYSNISCTSKLCSEVRSATSAKPGCSSTTCIYGIQYGDSSFSVGFFAKDTLSLGPSDTVPDFYFGCGENNQGLFGGSAGLLGLGRNHFSVMTQAASKYGQFFSYCLPSKSSSTGHLTFGKENMHSKLSKSMTYTPLLSSSAGPSFYFIELQGLSVGGKKLAISPTAFSQGGTIIDSGTVITRLPPDAYTALQAAFSKAMSAYPKAPALSILDTCFDFSKHTTVTVPKIGLVFSGKSEVVLPPSGIFYVKDMSQVCLAFAGNGDAGDVAILGNVQQLTFDIVYDVAGGKLGFSPGGCL